nr:reverse transcriptase domain-containing protein [Tanacetum cinerariifolium]
LMSSPNHPTFDIENTFSSNSPNYTPTLPDYSPASLGNTPSESLNNSYGLVPIATHFMSSRTAREDHQHQATRLGVEGAVGLIRWFKHTESVFSRSNCTEDCKPIGIEEAYKITWSEFKKLLIKKYCPRTEVKKMEDELYNLTVKGINLKTYVRRF